MAAIALKVDVDTLRGTREGVPALVKALERAGAGATFLFSMGPDHTGRAIRRALRPGFFGKVARTSVVEHYGLKTLMYGTLLPGPDIGKRESATLRSVAKAGFETGVHTWDHVRWQDGVAKASELWTRAELKRATERYTEVFGQAPLIHGAAGWQMNDAAFRLETEFGYALASDTRGRSPFVPVDTQGRTMGPPQFPTTLPTLDELLGRDGVTADNIHDVILGITRDGDSPQVYTLHAELEGQKLLGSFERLLSGWRAQGHTLVSVGQMAGDFDLSALDRCLVDAGTVPGRSGTLAVQGASWAA